jgi:hypothetical protein
MTATVDALVAGRFCRQSSSIATTAAAATAAAAAAGLPPPPPPPPWSNLPSSIAEERGNSSSPTSVPTAAPTQKHLKVQTIWTYLTYVQYLKCVINGRGNLAISKLLA